MKFPRDSSFQAFLERSQKSGSILFETGTESKKKLFKIHTFLALGGKARNRAQVLHATFQQDESTLQGAR
jgi:hypothetical protein